MPVRWSRDQERRHSRRDRVWAGACLVVGLSLAIGIAEWTGQSARAVPAAQEESAPAPAPPVVATDAPPAPTRAQAAVSFAPPLAAPAVAPTEVEAFHAADVVGSGASGSERVVGKIAPGATLASSLREQGVSSGTIALIAAEMAPHFDFRHARPGHRYELEFDGDTLSRFRYSTSEDDGFVMYRSGDAWQVARDRAKLVPRPARIAGLVTSSLYASIAQLGENPQLAHDFADIFAWDIDFSRSSHPGDSYKILYERLYRPEPDGSEVYVRPGRILAASYEAGNRDYTAVYFEPVEGRGSYYRPDGSSVEREIMMAPLRYARISSRFSRARRHPILNVTRPHQGIDYAAPAGTPVWAVADGTVIYRGWAGGFGNLVKVRHPKGFTSYYAHLSKFPTGMRVGDHVQQKQVIGYVGQTGLATGPHVCFRIAKDGKYVDPARLRTPAGPPVSPSLQHVFAARRDLLLSELNGGTGLVPTDEAL